MNARTTFPFLCLVLAALAPRAAAQPQATTRRPNILVILSDDQGWGDLSLNGNTNLSTPAIDALARSGASFDRFYVCPVCAPTRAEFLTGRYHPRGGVHGVSTGGERLNLDERTIADVFKAAGYATAAFGKWHNGSQFPYHPNGRGFDEYYGFTSGHWGAYFDPPLDHNGQPVTGHGYLADDLTDHAMAFIEQQKDHPFFCYLPFNTPHSPMQVPDPFWSKFAEKPIKLRATRPGVEEIPFTRAALAMCENIDQNVSRVLHKLDELHLADNTIVIYFSDNGPNSWRWNGGMKGIKGSTDEGGVRSPFMIRWPAHIKPETRVPQIAGAIDLLPTLADLAGVTIPAGKPLDGVSLKPLLEANAAKWPDRMIFSHWAGKVSLRTQRYRLDNADQLFDMEKDPGQTRDISADQKDLADRLSKALAQWKSEMLPGLKNDRRPFPVGYAEFPLTPLPARDGVPHENVRRSAGAPNCSFFTGWTSTQDSITWDIEVATTGHYEALIYYTCPQSDTGSEIELTFNGSTTRGTVTEANDPPLMGKEHDRVPRKSESYVKDFKPLTLATFDLKAGRGQLTLRATKVPGKEVMDVRAVTLKLIK
jgi:arylsulfatase A-like enzyme